MIDLQKIIDYYGLDKKILALVLFPDTNNPEHALWRRLKTSANPANRNNMSLEEVYNLAEFIGVTIDELLSISQWKLVPNKNKDVSAMISFKKGEYLVTLNLKTGISNIMHKDALLLSEKILVGDFIGLQTFLQAVDNIIENVLLTEN